MNDPQFFPMKSFLYIVFLIYYISDILYLMNDPKLFCYFNLQKYFWISDDIQKIIKTLIKTFRTKYD